MDAKVRQQPDEETRPNNSFERPQTTSFLFLLPILDKITMRLLRRCYRAKDQATILEQLIGKHMNDDDWEIVPPLSEQNKAEEKQWPVVLVQQPVRKKKHKRERIDKNPS